MTFLMQRPSMIFLYWRVLVTKKNILITGGTSGIGLNIVESLHQNYSFINLSRTSPSDSNKIYFAGSHMVDLLSPEENIKKALTYLKSKDLIFDGLVACAGMQKISSISSIREKDIVELFQLNLFSNVYLLKNMMRLGLVSEGASLIFLSSISADRPDVGISSYSMTKAAIDNFVKVAACEYAGKKIRVNSIRAGLINTPMIENERAYSKDFLQKEESKYKLGAGKPEYISNIVEFLLSDNSTWITGQNLTVDGGRSLHQ